MLKYWILYLEIKIKLTELVKWTEQSDCTKCIVDKNVKNTCIHECKLNYVVTAK